jgi:uncharacterized protein YyaL (SSP411 family)
MTGDSGEGRTNRLEVEESPYLHGRRHDPVDWYPWGEEALEKSRREDLPIFLVIGYTTCRWCQVMARESFTDPGLAQLMNERFVNILVDRQERPEIDEIYMAAAQVLNHQGGWPSTLFLTPELRPFFAGTYFPPEDRQDRPSFSSLIDSMHHAWTHRRDEVEMQAHELLPVMHQFLDDRGVAATAPPPAAVAMQAFESLRERFDPEWGGFGGPSKFPAPASLLLLLELSDTEPVAAEMLSLTLDHMARGGIYDQLGGGFHRCTLDRAWRRPQFEKMLPENAQLLEIYARWAQRTGDPQAVHIVRQTAAFMARELTAPEGGLWSGLDGEHHGHEGAPYVWMLGELVAVLGTENAGFLAPFLGFSGALAEGEDAYVLHRPRPLLEEAFRRRTTVADLLANLAPLEARLLERRSERPPPARDEQVLTGWNGLGIAGLAVAGEVLDDSSILGQAVCVAEFVRRELWSEQEGLLRLWYRGKARLEANLEDYVFLVHGLLALHRVLAEGPWLEMAQELTAEQGVRLGSAAGGFFTAAPRPDLLCRSRQVFDGALPATNAVAILNLLELGQLDPQGPWRPLAEKALRAFSTVAEAQAESARGLCLAAWRGRA